MARRRPTVAIGRRRCYIIALVFVCHLAEQVGHHRVPVLGIRDAAEHALMDGKGETVVEGVSDLWQPHVEAQGVEGLAVFVLLSQLLEVVGVDVIEAVALVAQVDARKVVVTQLLRALQQAAGDVEAIKVALIGFADIKC